MRVPKVGKPRAANAAAVSLSRRLPKLQLPLSAAQNPPARPKPKIAKPGKAVAGMLTVARKQGK